MKNFIKNLGDQFMLVEIFKKGEKISKENIRIIRPGFGLMPKFYSRVLGKYAKKKS